MAKETSQHILGAPANLLGLCIIVITSLIGIIASVVFNFWIK